jgi:citrate lyase beta subunit
MSLGLFGEKRQSSEAALVEQQLEDALARIQKDVNLNSVRAHLHEKRERHNQRALAKRMARIRAARIPCTKTTFVVGPEAAATVTLDTVVRASTLEEKATLRETQQPQGLHVREGTADALLGVLTKLKADPSRSFPVSELLTLLKDDQDVRSDHVCPLTILSFAHCFVELGGIAIVR